MNAHLDLLALDALRAGEGSPEERAHLMACEECRATVNGFDRLARALAPAPVDVPADVKRRVLAMTRPRRAWRPFVAAGVALIALGITWLCLAPVPARPRRVDIVDAYRLAMRLKLGKAVGPADDVNRDGKVDERDVEEIARRSVALK